MQFGAQGIERRVEGLAQPGNVEFPEGLGRPVQRDQFITEAAMLEAVVQVEFAGGETLAELPIDPEFIAVPPQAGRVAVIIGVEQMWAQPLGYGVPGDFAEGPLGKGAADGRRRPSSRTGPRARDCRSSRLRRRAPWRADADASCTVPPCDRPLASGAPAD